MFDLCWNCPRAGTTRPEQDTGNRDVNRQLDRYYAAACQLDSPNPTSRDQIHSRVDRMLEMVEYAVTGYEPFHDVKLVVFPEFGHAAPIFPTVDELLDRLAVSIPNDHTERYAKKARKLGVFIQTGTFLESDSRWPGHVFNTTCLIGPDGMLSKYRKVHPWTPWEVHTSPHDLPGYDEPIFPVAETEIGNIGTAICYDWLFPEAIRQLALAGAEVLVRSLRVHGSLGHVAANGLVDTGQPDAGRGEHGLRRGVESGLQLDELSHLLAGPGEAWSSTSTAERSLKPHLGLGSRSWSDRSTWPLCGTSANDDADTICLHICVTKRTRAICSRSIQPARPPAA